MANLFATGEIASLIAALMLVELIVLIIVRKKIGRGMSVLALIASLGAGAALLLALREALKGSGWQSIALWLLVALAAHSIDLKMRWASK